ncbi:MAG TPA: hypothetical protein VJY35_10615 [Candidatus Eisenbacteria bacterium]|nr:hypothetical protein [Candidatus Eisenbacteria bacterium]
MSDRPALPPPDGDNEYRARQKAVEGVDLAVLQRRAKSAIEGDARFMPPRDSSPGHITGGRGAEGNPIAGGRKGRLWYKGPRGVVPFMHGVHDPNDPNVFEA